MFFSCTSVAWVLTKYEYEYEFCDNFITRVQSNMAIGSIAVLPPLAMFNAFVPRMRWRGTFVTHRYVAIGRYNYVKRAPFVCVIWILSKACGYLAHTILLPQTASRSVQPFLHSSPECTTHRHTDRHALTDHATCDVCSDRPYLCIA